MRISFLFIFLLIYLMQVFLNHYYFKSYCYDYGFFNYNFYQFAHLNYAPQYLYDPPLQGFFSNHLAFIFVFVSLLYWPLNWIFGTYTLLFIQAALLILGSNYTYKLVLLKSKNKWYALIVMLCSLVILGKFSTLSFDYIDTAIGASLLPLFLYYFEKEKFLISSILFVLVLSAKENMALMMFFLSVTLILTNKKGLKKFRFSIVYALFCLFYFILSFAILIPAFEDPVHSYFGFQFSVLGETPSEALKFIFTHPFKTFLLMFQNHLNDPLGNGVKAEMYWLFLICGGILLILRPVWILPFIPLIGQKVFNDHTVRWGILIFYMIEIVILLPIACYYSIEKLKYPKLKLLLLILMFLTTTFMTLNKLHSRTAKYYRKDKENILISKFYHTNLDIKKLNRHLQNIPSNEIISCTGILVPHLAYREKIYNFPVVKDSKLIILLRNRPNYPLSPKDFENKFNEILNSEEWFVEVDDYPLIIFKRIESR